MDVRHKQSHEESGGQKPAERLDSERFRDGGRRRSRRSSQFITLVDVGKAAGVSQQTVSRAIRSPLLVSGSTLERVRYAIEATGYVPNLAASNLASNRSMTVAAILPVISGSIFADAVYELEGVLTAAGYQLFIGATGYRLNHEEQLVRAFLGRRPDGFFIVGTNHTEGTRVLLQRTTVPIVETWDLTSDPVDYLVGYSNWHAAEAMVEHVVQRGYLRPTFAGSFNIGDTRSAARKEAFEQTVRRLLPGEAIRLIDSEADKMDMDAGVELLRTSLAKYPETDVLMFSSDTFAAGALLECARLDIAVPDSLAVTGFGDFEIARHLVPGLTSVATPNRETGRRAGEVLLQAMSGEPVEQRVLDLGFAVVARGSA